MLRLVPGHIGAIHRWKSFKTTVIPLFLCQLRHIQYLAQILGLTTYPAEENICSPQIDISIEPLHSHQLIVHL